MKVSVKESIIVRPAQDTPHHGLWLSGMDLRTRWFHPPFVYLYNKSNGIASNFFETKVLKEALSEVLVPFYPVAGRLGRDESGRFEIKCNGEGVLLKVAETDVAMADLGDCAPGLELLQLSPTLHVDDDTTDMSSYPLLVLQVTRFICGGVCIGVLWHNTLADGTGAVHFINSWSTLARGLSIITLPFLDRTILRRWIPCKPQFHHIEFDQLPAMNASAQNQSGNSEATCTAIFDITLDQLNALRALTENNETKARYSTYKILTAHIWRCVTKARSLPDDQLVNLYLVVNGQTRMHPPLPPTYFGRVLCFATSSALSGELLSESPMQTVERVHKAINGLDDEYVKSALAFLEAGLGVLRVPLVSPRPNPNLFITSWRGLSFYDADFGWGPPSHVRPAEIIEGKGYILPTPPNNKGSVSFAMCLQANNMEAFRKLYYDSLHLSRL